MKLKIKLIIILLSLLGYSSSWAFQVIGGGSSVTETDPVFTAWDKDYADLINPPAIPSVNTLATSTLSCAEGEIAKLVSGVWTCAADSEGTGTDDQTAAEVPFTPAGSIIATDTQGAIEELEGDFVALPFLDFDDTQFIEDTTTTPGTSKISIEPSILGGGSSAFFVTTDPTTSSANGFYQNTVDFSLWTKSADWLCEVGVSCTAIDTIPPVIAPAFLADGTLALNATDNEVGAITADCTKFTADCATAGPITFTGAGPCTASPSVYSGDTCSGTDAGGTVVDAAGNPSEAGAVTVLNGDNTTTPGSVKFLDDSFTVEVATSLATHSPTPTGGTWVVLDDTGVNNIDATYNRLELTVAAGKLVAYNDVTPPTANYSVSSLALLASTDSTRIVKVCGRMSIDGLTGYCAKLKGAAFGTALNLELVRIDAGVDVPLGSVPLTTLHGSSVFYDIAVSMDEGSISASESTDNVSVTIPDSTYTAAGKPALMVERTLIRVKSIEADSL